MVVTFNPPLTRPCGERTGANLKASSEYSFRRSTMKILGGACGQGPLGPQEAQPVTAS